MHEVRRNSQERAALSNRFPHPLEVGVLKVPKTTMDDLVAVGRGRGAKISLLDEGNG